MNHIRHIRRTVGILAGLAAALVALGGAPAFAMLLPPSAPGAGNPVVAPAPPQIRTVTHTVVVGGMPGWQIILIAVGAALLAAAVAVLADRARAARRSAIDAAA